MKIIFIRHLPTPGNEKRQYIGSTDESLSAGAVKAFREKEVRYPDVQSVITSPMKRCIETARLIYPETEIRMEPMLRECDFGEYEGKTYEELKNRRASTLRRAGCKEDAGGNELQQSMAIIEGMLQKLDEQERRFSVLSEQTMQKYADLQRQTAQIDADKMNAAQQSVRAKYQDAAKKKLEDTFGKRYSLMRMVNSQRQVERLMKAKDDSEKKQERTKEKER